MQPVVIMATEMLQYYVKWTQMYTIIIKEFVFNVFSANIRMQNVDIGSVV